MKTFLPLLLLLTTACATGSLPPLAPAENPRGPDEARRLLDRAIEARGGNPFEKFDDLAVRYEGRWGRIAPLIQPVVADRPHRQESEERLLLGPGVDGQIHQGPAGIKHVLRTPESSAVRFSDRETVEEDERAAALVADAYRLFLLGAAWVDRHAVSLSTPGPERIDGTTWNRVDAFLRPGFGFSDGDRVRLWLDPESGRLHRVLFSLEGFETTRGAEVDVTFLDWRQIEGLWWPVEFRERIRAPVRAFAHYWRLTGLDVDRGLEPRDLAVDGWSERAARPAEGLAVVPSAGG